MADNAKLEALRKSLADKTLPSLVRQVLRQKVAELERKKKKKVTERQKRVVPEEPQPSTSRGLPQPRTTRKRRAPLASIQNLQPQPAFVRKRARIDMSANPENRKLKLKVDRRLAPIRAGLVRHRPVLADEDAPPTARAGDSVHYDDDDWRKKHLVFHDSRYNIYIREVAFARRAQKNSKLNLNDHLFQLKIHQLDDYQGTGFNKKGQYVAPRMLDIIDHVWTAMRDCVADIKRRYAEPHLNTQIMIVFHHGGFSHKDGKENMIEVGHYSLSNDSTAFIVDNAMTLLEATLRSKDHLNLDDDFQVTIKVIGTNRVREAEKEGFLVGGAPVDPANPTRIMKRVRNVLTNSNQQTLFVIPDDPEWNSQCLPIVVLLGYYYKRERLYKYSTVKNKSSSSCKEDAAVYNVIRQINLPDSNEKQKRMARKKLQSLVDQLLMNLGLDKKQAPYDMEPFLTDASRLLRVQFAVYSNQGSRMIFRYPSKFDPTLPQIYLYNEQYYGSDVSHMSLIRNIKAFMIRAGYVCDYCDKTRKAFHFCKTPGVTCFGCHRIVVRYESVYIDQDNVGEFCLRFKTSKKDDDFVQHRCGSCNVEILTRKCEERHKKRICEAGFVCLTQPDGRDGCKRFIKRSRNFTLAQLREAHRCEMETCRICYKEYDTGIVLDEETMTSDLYKDVHFCKMPIMGLQAYFRPLAFYDFEAYNHDLAIGCAECYNLEVKYCDEHFRKVREFYRLKIVKGWCFMDEKVNDATFERNDYLFKQLLDLETVCEEFGAYLVDHCRSSVIVQKSIEKHYFDVGSTKRKLSRRNIERLLDMNLVDAARVRCGRHVEQQQDEEMDGAEQVNDDEGTQTRGFSYFLGEHVPNYCVMYYESHNQHGQFDRQDFCDPAMQHPNMLKIQENVLQFDYLPPEITDRSLQTKKHRGGAGRSVGGSKSVFPQTYKEDLELPSRSPEDYPEEDVYDDVAQFVGAECDVASDASEDEDEEDEEEEQQSRNIIKDFERKDAKRRANKELLFGKEEQDLEDLGTCQTVDQFLLTILCEKFRNYCFLAHHASGYDLQFLVKRMHAHGIQARQINRHSRLLRVHVPYFNIVFLDTLLYLNGSLSSLTKAFGLSTIKGFFPHGYNKPSSYKHDPALVPDMCYFASFNDSKQMREEKEKFVAELRESGAGWDFKQELAKYCDSDVRLLAEASCAFLRQSLLFQQPLIASEVKAMDPSLTHIFANALEDRKFYLNPFSPPFMTLSSFVYGMFRRYALPSFDIYAMKDEQGLNAVKTSRGEQEFALYIKDRLPHRDVQSAFTSRLAPRFGRVRPDIYIGGDANTVYNFHGCATHIHKSPDCTAQGLDWIRASDNPVNHVGETHDGVRAKEERHAVILEQEHGIPREKQKVIWECGWERLKRADWETLTPQEKEWAGAVRDFMLKFDRRHPRHRLAPRTGLRGGKTEAYRFFWEKALAPPGESLLYWDYNSLYPSVACYLYPIGKPLVLIKPEELATLRFDEKDGQAYLLDPETGGRRDVRGLLQCKVLCPQTLVLPFLSLRIEQKIPKGPKTEKSVSPICAKCAETMNRDPCEHDEDERSLVSTWTLAEIGYAVVKLGYKLVTSYECYAYPKSAHVFKDFLEPFARNKIINSGFPDDTSATAESRQAYVDSVNEGMDWQEGRDANYVTVDDIQDNPSQRSWYKLCQNALLGKLGQNTSDKIQCCVVNSQRELDELVNDRKDCDVTDFVIFSDYAAEIFLKPKTPLNRPNLKSNVTLAAHVTAYARIEMDRCFRLLEAEGSQIYYTDTDSIIFTVKPGMKQVLKEGPALHQFKSEIAKGWSITKFYALAPKLYELTETNDVTGAVRVHSKVKGFYVNSERQKNKLSEENIFSNFVKSFLKGDDEQITLGQWSITTTKERAMQSVIVDKVLKNSIYSKRVAFRNPELSNNNLTLPYGFTQELFEQYVE